LVAAPIRSVLIADDDPGIRESLREVLGRDGWETVVAENGHDALLMVRVRVVHVAMVDMGMPDMQGVETLRALRRASERLAMVAMTADRGRYAREDLVAAGAMDLLWKPLRIPEVRRALAEALRGLDGAGGPGPAGPRG
jgi:CheY-like chemotaxis protein